MLNIRDLSLSYLCPMLTMRFTSFSESRSPERPWRSQCSTRTTPTSPVQKLRLVPEQHISRGRQARSGLVCGSDTECCQHCLLSGRLEATGCVAPSRMSRWRRKSAIVLYNVEADERAGLLLPGRWWLSSGCTAGACGRMQQWPDELGHWSHCIRSGVAVDSVGTVEPVLDGESGWRCQCATVAALRRIDCPTLVVDRTTLINTFYIYTHKKTYVYAGRFVLGFDHTHVLYLHQVLLVKCTRSSDLLLLGLAQTTHGRSHGRSGSGGVDVGTAGDDALAPLARPDADAGALHRVLRLTIGADLFGLRTHQRVDCFVIVCLPCRRKCRCTCCAGWFRSSSPSYAGRHHNGYRTCQWFRPSSCA